MMIKLIPLLLLFISSFAFANDAEFTKVKKNLFWPKLYNNEYQTLYCDKTKTGRTGIDVEHVYATHWIAQYLGCINRTKCDNDTYKTASSDLHNLWPAITKFKRSRGKQAFGEIDGNMPRFPKIKDCDFERTTGFNAIVEPRDDAKGDIARSILYMLHTYNLPDREMLPMLVKWHFNDKVDAEERRRNDKIEELQGTRNPFIE